MSEEAKGRNERCNFYYVKKNCLYNFLLCLVFTLPNELQTRVRVQLLKNRCEVS